MYDCEPSSSQPRPIATSHRRSDRKAHLELRRAEQRNLSKSCTRRTGAIRLTMATAASASPPPDTNPTSITSGTVIGDSTIANAVPRLASTSGSIVDLSAARRTCDPRLTRDTATSDVSATTVALSAPNWLGDPTLATVSGSRMLDKPDAIWSAVPHIALVLSGLRPRSLTMASPGCSANAAKHPHRCPGTPNWDTISPIMSKEASCRVTTSSLLRGHGYTHFRTFGGELQILIFAPSFEPAVKSGGPARSLSNLERELRKDFDVDVVTRDRDLGDVAPFEGLSGRSVRRGTTIVHYINERSPRQWWSVIRRLRRNDYALIMINSFWDPAMALLPCVLRRVGAIQGEVLLLPRGELEPGALAMKARKKTLAGPAFRALYRQAVTVFGATSRSEADNISRWFPEAKVVTTTNNIPDSIDFGVPREQSSILRAIFLSRINAKKGLLPLLRGLALTKSEIRLTIVGPVEDPAYWRECEGAIRDLPEHVTVIHQGAAPRDSIGPLLWNADCMVLLTAGENYGHVIAESLQAGCPVITTPTTPWTHVLRLGGGEIIEDRDDPTQVAATLDSWAGKTLSAKSASRHRAREAFSSFQQASGPNMIRLALDSLSSQSAPRTQSGARG